MVCLLYSLSVSGLSQQYRNTNNNECIPCFHSTDSNLSSEQQHVLSAMFGAPRDRDREVLSMQLVMQQMKLDNEQLRKQLVDSKLNTDNYR